MQPFNRPQNRCSFRSCAFVLALLVVVPNAKSKEPFDFAHNVLPILRERCAKCHSGDRIEGDFSLENRQALLDADVIDLEDPDNSAILERITSTDPDERMPAEGEPLTAEETAAFRRWIRQGAPWEKSVTLKPSFRQAPLAPRRPTLPEARDGRTNPVDRIVDDYYANQGIAQPLPLGDAAFMRRLYLNAIGLLPTPEAVAAFCDDRDSDKHDRVIREVLENDVAYAEHWLTFWNDMLRNDYAGTGYIDGGRRQISKWLYQSLVDNKPYDQFVRELIDASEASEGFIRGIQWRGRVNASQQVELQFAQNVGQVFLGINLKCASCHDSFIDNRKLADSYALAAVVAEKPLELHRCDKPTGEMARASFLFPDLGTIDPELSRPERLAQLAGLLTHEQNGRFTRTIVNRLWQRLMGRGIVDPVDAMDNEPFCQDLLDHLAIELVDQGYDLKRIIEQIVTSAAYQSQSVVVSDDAAREDGLFRGPIVKRMTAEQFVDAIQQTLGGGPSKAAFQVEKHSGDKVRSALVVSSLLTRSLGRPNREQVITTRPDNLTMLVALDLTNGPILEKMIAQGADRLMKKHPDRTASQTIEWLYQATLCRGTTPNEMAVALEITGKPLSREGLSDLLWTVFMLPEFQFVW